jgi:transposase-like protein
MCSMPWTPRVGREEVENAVSGAWTWRDVLTDLGYAYHGKNIETVRKWARRWGISTEHLSDNRGLRRARYSDDELRRAVGASFSWAETLRRLGYCPSGNNWRTLKNRVAELGISTKHFDPYAASRARGPQRRIPLEEVLVRGSTYNRGALKRRLYQAGLKTRRCELCGQGETWRGHRINLILDHINGVRDDNRLENLRIVCPNCAASLDTHCGRNLPRTRECAGCGHSFTPKHKMHRYCSHRCFSENRVFPFGIPRPESRKVDRPPYEQLMREIEETSYLAVGRKYGVSDNAVRKWVRFYERQRERELGGTSGGEDDP